MRSPCRTIGVSRSELVSALPTSPGLSATIKPISEKQHMHGHKGMAEPRLQMNVRVGPS